MRDPAEKVVVSYIRPSLIHGDFAESLMDMMDYDRATHHRIAGRLSFKSGSNLSQARNKVCEQFLIFGQADWLLMIDTDMTFGQDALERILEYADPEASPVVGGLCFGFDEQGLVQPTLYDAADFEGNGNVTFVRYHDWKPDSMMQVVGTGAAFLLVHKSVLEKVRDKGFNRVFPWFQETYLQDKVIGEDITFCLRVGQCEVPVFVNTAVQIGHIKERILTMDGYFASRGLLSFSHKGVAP